MNKYTWHPPRSMENRRDDDDWNYVITDTQTICAWARHAPGKGWYLGANEFAGPAYKAISRLPPERYFATAEEAMAWFPVLLELES